jgi:membrane protease YdiL (CAAX protease family)
MDDEDLKKKKTVRNIAIFAVVVISIGWVGHGLDVLLGNPSSGSLGMLLWIGTPLGVCFLLRVFGGGGWKDFGIKLNFKGNLLGYSIAILVFPVITTLILIIGKFAKFVTFPSFFSGTLGVILQVFMLGLLPAFFKNIFEEFAWRGYLTPKVYALNINDYAGHLIVGLIWALWHIPYYLFFLDRVVFRDYTTLSLALFIPMALMTILSYSLVFGEIRLMTNSLWPVVLMHAIEDALVNPLLIEGFIKIKPGMDLFFSPGVSIMVIVFFGLAGVLIHRLRSKK